MNGERLEDLIRLIATKAEADVVEKLAWRLDRLEAKVDRLERNLLRTLSEVS